MGKVKFRKVASVFAITSVALLSAGCSVVEDTASRASDQLTDAASKELVRQACAPIQDGTINSSELRVLSSIVGSVEGGGLPEDMVNVLNELADSGDKAPAALQDRLKTSCDNATAQSN
ncbi:MULTISPECIES: hypothetical protein [Micrococcaceae]|uniref:hypothetical protein n=1 Tax=Micrococcaceae TaxID=1268 RepID=UPI00103576E0|nr:MULTISPECIES: hypothetical protein [Micrococcaceae]TAP28154.1 hypothetical protein EYR88_07560 [Arthrobacter sp. S41]UXN33041.1 hypothetical protein N6V40_06345 [Glutamicibacter sp. M10]